MKSMWALSEKDSQDSSKAADNYTKNDPPWMIICKTRTLKGNGIDMAADPDILHKQQESLSSDLW